MNYENKNDTLEIDFGEDFSDAEIYSVPRKNRENRSVGNLAGKIGFPLLIVASILVLFILSAGFYQRSNSIDFETNIKSLETRIEQLEQRLYQLDWIQAKLDQIEEENLKFTTFMNSLKRLETLSRPATFQPPKEETKVLYHRVRTGQTLYGISRRHGLTVEELRRLNKLSPKDHIYPDQKLLIRSAHDQ